MTLRISGKSISVGDALRGRVSERTDEVLRKYFDGNYSGHITLSKDGFGFRTDCALHLDSGITLEADSNAAAINRACSVMPFRRPPHRPTGPATPRRLDCVPVESG